MDVVDKRLRDCQMAPVTLNITNLYLKIKTLLIDCFLYYLFPPLSTE